MKTYILNMTLSVDKCTTEDEILDKLIELAETNGWLLGGGLLETDENGENI